ncbi:MAG: DUF1080 domain-containing protein [Chloroflexia bacterium]
MKNVARFATLTCSAIAAGMLLYSQQAAVPTPPRAPTPPLTKSDLEAIPLTPPRPGKSVRKALFDGKTLQGWRGNLDWWSVKDGAIVGKFHDKVPTSFLYTNDTYSDFRLTLSSKMVESENHAGVAFWGDIIERGDNKWYTRGPLVIFPKPGMWDYIDAKGISVYRPTTEPVTSQYEWIQVEILAQGNRVRTAFNGVEVMDWREANPERVKGGPIGVQLHAWTGPQEVLYKDIVIEIFPKESRLLTLKN